MSFKTKTIVILIVLSLTPYVITMFYLGNVYRQDLEERLIEDMEYQLGITIDRLDQNLEILEQDVRFMASLDIMNDILTGDLDRRITDMLLIKKADLDLLGEFDVANDDGIIVASTDLGRLGNPAAEASFLSVPVNSSFNESRIGQLSVSYRLENLTRLFANNDNLQYVLLEDGQAVNGGTIEDPLSVERSLNHAGLAVRLDQDRDFAFAALASLTTSFGLALVIGILVIAVAAYLIASYILHPILQLSATARSITRTQDYSQRVPVERGDEIGQLSSAFNTMIGGMQDMLARLREESENRIKLAKEKDRAEMLQSLSTKLSKYLSPQIYESIFSGERDVTLTASRKKLTIFFSDIVDFTSTTDQMESEDLTLLLNQYLREMTEIALRFGATVDKYIGDAVMIFFGDPHSLGVKEDAIQCVKMAMAMQERVRELQDEWQNAGFAKPFRIRVGIHTGYCTVGNFGTESRMDYTIVGSAVNLASRIESSARPGGISLSEDTWLLVRHEIDCMPVSSITPKGFSQAVPLYEVVRDQAGDLIRLQEEGVNITIDPSRVKAGERDNIRRLLARFLDEQDD